MSLTFELPLSRAAIKVVGVGSASLKAIHYLEKHPIEGVDLLGIDANSKPTPNFSSKFIAIGQNLDLIDGLGTLGHTDLARQAVLDATNVIEETLADTDLLIIAADLGESTGCGATPEIARIAKELGILTLVVVNKPLPFLGESGLQKAEHSIATLSRVADAYAIANETFGSWSEDQTAKAKNFEAVLFNFSQCISDLLNQPGIINLDFADIRAVLSGKLAIGIGAARGENRAEKAAHNAIADSISNGINPKGATRGLANITCGKGMTIEEFNRAGEVLRAVADPTIEFLMGTVINPTMEDSFQVSIIWADLPVDNKIVGKKTAADPSALDDNSIQLIAADSTPDEELAELILHLSNVYRSVGGDELVVTNVKTVPPTTNIAPLKTTAKKAGNL